MKRLMMIVVLVIVGSALLIVNSRADDPIEVEKSVVFEKEALLHVPLLATYSTTRFYDEYGYSFAWDPDQLQELIQAINDSAFHGLSPQDYHIHELTSGTLSTTRRDVLATDAFLLLGRHLLTGKVDPKQLHPEWTARTRQLDIVKYLKVSLEGEHIYEDLHALSPQYASYKILQDALQEARRQGDSDREASIRVNLERWRWLPEEFGDVHIRVNIADFKLSCFEGGLPTRTHTVIVGKNQRKTPFFSADIQYVVLNPWWEVPKNIAKHDLLPKFKKQPSMIETLGYHFLDDTQKIVDRNSIDWTAMNANTFNLRIRQQPGPYNALGEVKIMFPNSHNVYLHDTSSKELFALPKRNFSSGCIRVENPIALTEWVLIHGNVDSAAAHIQSALESKKETRINLKRTIPVYMLYWTVVVEPEGDHIEVKFLEDVYERDAAVFSALTAPAN